MPHRSTNQRYPTASTVVAVVQTEIPRQQRKRSWSNQNSALGSIVFIMTVMMGVILAVGFPLVMVVGGLSAIPGAPPTQARAGNISKVHTLQPVQGVSHIENYEIKIDLSPEQIASVAAGKILELNVRRGDNSLINIPVSHKNIELSADGQRAHVMAKFTKKVT